MLLCRAESREEERLNPVRDARPAVPDSRVLNNEDLVVGSSREDTWVGDELRTELEVADPNAAFNTLCEDWMRLDTRCVGRTVADMPDSWIVWIVVCSAAELWGLRETETLDEAKPGRIVDVSGIIEEAVRLFGIDNEVTSVDP